jgi:hypothetical protein
MSHTRSRQHRKEAHEGQATMVETEGKFQAKPVQTWERPFESTPAKQIRVNVVPRTITPKAKKEFKGPVSNGKQLTLQQHPEERIHNQHMHPSTNFVRKIEAVKGCTYSDEDLLKMTETIKLILETTAPHKDDTTETTEKSETPTKAPSVTNLDDSDEEDETLPNPELTLNVVDLTQLRHDLSLSEDDTSDDDQ